MKKTNARVCKYCGWRISVDGQVLCKDQYNEACLHFAQQHPGQVRKGNVILDASTVNQVLIK